LKKFPSKAWLLTLLLAVAFILAACGGVGSGQQGDQCGGHGKMDHGQMGHGSMGMGSKDMARQMVMQNGKYSDRRFIDAMVPHHQGAIAMARVALGNAEHEEINELSRNIISTQQAEIEELNAIKRGIRDFAGAHGDGSAADAEHDDEPAALGPERAFRQGVHRRHDPAPPLGDIHGPGRPREEQDCSDQGARGEHHERPEAGDRADEAVAQSVVPRGLD
jgi:hypothetical protein